MSTPVTRKSGRGRNRYVLLGLVGVVFAMNGFAYAMVPAYRAFCQKFGFAGTPLVKEESPATEEILLDRVITVRFDSNIEPELDWRFKPIQRSMDLKVGETGLAFYEAMNRADHPITGTATFNVTPYKAAPYFAKIQCFCFTEQTLSPGESVDMPVTFFVDPAIAEDRNLDDVTTITLSYTFFRDPNAEANREAAAVETRDTTQVN